MHLEYIVAIKNRPEMVIKVSIQKHDPSISDEEFAIYKRDNECKRIKIDLANKHAFRIENRIFNPEAIDYVIVSIAED